MTLELWADADNDGGRSCCSAEAVRGARRLAHGLGMPHFTLDLRDEFREGVVDPWLREHADGLTPNPCVRCNGHVRLDAMLDFADRLGAATLTTGHYARRTENGLLRRALDPAKDQTYMLAALRRESLARLRFPLGEHTKERVRALAEQAGLAAAASPSRRISASSPAPAASASSTATVACTSGPATSSTEAVACSAATAGTTATPSGSARGSGSRPASRSTCWRPMPARTPSPSAARAELATTTVRVRGLRLHDREQPDAVQLRYHAPALRCRLDGDQIHLDEPFDGAAPGQTAVFLRGDAIVGCATIAA